MNESDRISSKTTVMVEDFGLAGYEAVWQRQKALVQQRLSGEISDTLLLGEHRPVITLGRGTHAENLLNPSIPVVEIERGGDVTYHGPGQLVAYPILLLPEGERDLHRYLRDLEEVVIQTIRQFGLQGVRNPGWTGVWVQSPESGQLLKLSSIGVAVKKWVTYHGLALNVEPNLSHFAQINPCGLESQVMTSMARLLGRSISMDAVKQAMLQAFHRCFGLERSEYHP